MVIFATFRALSQRRRQLLLQVGDRVIAFADSGDVLGDELIAFVTFRRQVGYFAFSSASCFCRSAICASTSAGAPALSLCRRR